MSRGLSLELPPVVEQCRALLQAENWDIHSVTSKARHLVTAATLDEVKERPIWALAMHALWISPPTSVAIWKCFTVPSARDFTRQQYFWRSIKQAASRVKNVQAGQMAVWTLNVIGELAELGPSTMQTLPAKKAHRECLALAKACRTLGGRLKKLGADWAVMEVLASDPKLKPHIPTLGNSNIHIPSLARVTVCDFLSLLEQRISTDVVRSSLSQPKSEDAPMHYFWLGLEVHMRRTYGSPAYEALSAATQLLYPKAEKVTARGIATWLARQKSKRSVS